MKTVAICYSEIEKIYKDAIIRKFYFCDINIPVGILSIEESDYSLKTDFDVLIKVNSFSCNYRDRSLFIQFNHRCRQLTTDNQITYSPFGSEFVAVVLAVGKDVKTLKIGDRVIPNCHYYDRTSIAYQEGIPTNFASQRLHIFHENKLVKIPDFMPDDIAASFSIASQTAYSMIRKANLSKGETVLVTAATSNTSLAVIRALKNKEVKIYATSSNKENEDWLSSWGIDEFIPLKRIANKKLYDKFNKNIHFDVVIDPFYDLYLNGIINHINFNGRYIYCGLYEQYQSLDTSSFFKEDYKNIFRLCIIRNISIIGNCIGIHSDLEKAINDYSEKKYDIAIDSVYSDLDIIPFLERSFKASSRIGKVIYKYQD